MVGSLLLRGMIVGLLAGILVFAFAKTFGEPMVDRAIAFEEQESAAKGEVAEPEIVSRATQASTGLATGALFFSTAAGGIFSLVFAYVYGRIGTLRARATSALLALGAFVSIVLVPQIKYPANPPAVGNPDTIGSRTELFFIMIVLSIAALCLAVGLARRLWAQYGGWNACMISAIAFIVVIAVIQLLLPTVNEVPDNFSAVVLWRFRTVSIGMHVILWTVLGFVFGALAEKALESGQQRGLAHAAR